MPRSPRVLNDGLGSGPNVTYREHGNGSEGVPAVVVDNPNPEYAFCDTCTYRFKITTPGQTTCLRCQGQ